MPHPHSFFFCFPVLISTSSCHTIHWFLVSPSLFNVIEFKYIYFYVKMWQSKTIDGDVFSDAGRYRYAMQIPRASTMFFFICRVCMSIFLYIFIHGFKNRNGYAKRWRCGGDLVLHFNQYFSFHLKWWHLLQTWLLWRDPNSDVTKFTFSTASVVSLFIHSRFTCWCPNGTEKLANGNEWKLEKQFRWLPKSITSINGKIIAHFVCSYFRFRFFRFYCIWLSKSKIRCTRWIHT